MSGELFVHEQGDGRTVIVLLHGFGATHGSWKDVQGRLAENATTLAIDLPGHGHSLDFVGDLSPRSAAAAVTDLLHARGAEAVHLVGHSMGGAIATLIALASPALVASLTLLAPGGFGPEINHRLLGRYAAARSRTEIQAVLEVMCGWNHPISGSVLDDYVRMREDPRQVEVLQGMAAAMASGGYQGVIAPEKLARLEMPVSLVWGLQDCVLPARQSRGLPPSFAVHLLADTGHMLPMEQVGTVSRVIRHRAVREDSPAVRHPC